jgi:hypothetical protein
MKKFLLAVLVVVITISANAQRAITLPLAAGDTAVNAGTSVKVLPVITTGFAGAAIEVVLTRNSGTGAGSLVIQGSNDGTNYTTIGSTYTITNSASQSTLFYITEPLPMYLRSYISGGTTMSVTQTIKYVYRKHD